LQITTQSFIYDLSVVRLVQDLQDEGVLQSLRSYDTKYVQLSPTAPLTDLKSNTFGGSQNL